MAGNVNEGENNMLLQQISETLTRMDNRLQEQGKELKQHHDHIYLEEYNLKRDVDAILAIGLIGALCYFLFKK